MPDKRAAADPVDLMVQCIAARNRSTKNRDRPRFQKTFEYRTRGRGTTDITADVQRVVAGSGIQQGLCNVFLQHTSASLILCENADPDVRRDLETLLSRLAPDGDPAYVHDTEGPDDMAAHARSVLTSNSISIPAKDGRLLLGTWQGIDLFEHRKSPHQRNVVVTFDLPRFFGPIVT